jgi:GT2 family glycosyltransferase
MGAVRTRASDIVIPTLSVILVTYRSRPFIDACLDSLVSAIGDLSAEIVVVDNASGDGIVAHLAARHPRVRAIASPVNGGFAHGINLGLAATTGRYVLWLNPDSRVRPESSAGLRDWLDWMDAHPDVGICGGRVLDPDGRLQRSVRSFPSYTAVLGARYSVLTRWWPSNPFTRRYLRDDLTYDTPVAVDWVSGACLLHRRATSDALGGPDDGFFMYFEDVDFCYRAWQGGWKVFFHPSFVVEHHIGGSSRHVAVRMLRERHRSMWRWYTKHFRRFWAKDAAVWVGIWVRFAVMAAAQAWRR